MKRGMTILETLVALTIFMLFAVYLSNIWITTRNQGGYMIARARLLREAMTARATLLADLSTATAVSCFSDNFVLLTPAQSSITYYRRYDAGDAYGRLIRTDSASGSMTVAAYLSALSYGLELSPPGFVSTFTFASSPNTSKGAANLTLRVRAQTLSNP